MGLVTMSWKHYLTRADPMQLSGDVAFTTMMPSDPTPPLPPPPPSLLFMVQDATEPVPDDPYFARPVCDVNDVFVFLFVCGFS